LSRVPDGCLTPRRTGRLTVGHNLTSTSVLRWFLHYKNFFFLRSGAQYTSALFRIQVTNYLTMTLKSMRYFNVFKIDDFVMLSDAKANCTLICSVGSVKYDCVLNVGYYI
jgi:hypothetical protein